MLVLQVSFCLELSDLSWNYVVKVALHLMPSRCADSGFGAGEGHSEDFI